MHVIATDLPIYFGRQEDLEGRVRRALTILYWVVTDSVHAEKRMSVFSIKFPRERKILWPFQTKWVIAWAVKVVYLHWVLLSIICQWLVRILTHFEFSPVRVNFLSSFCLPYLLHQLQGRNRWTEWQISVSRWSAWMVQTAWWMQYWLFYFLINT